MEVIDLTDSNQYHAESKVLADIINTLNHPSIANKASLEKRLYIYLKAKHGAIPEITDLESEETPSGGQPSETSVGL